MRRVFALLAVAAVAAATASCGSNAPQELPDSGATLEGTVMFGNEQVMFGLIIVQTGGASSTGRIDPETGKYLVQNVPLGDVMVAVNTDAGQGDYMTAVMNAGKYKGPDGKGVGKVNLKKIDIPKKYQDAKTSGFTYPIQKGTNTFNIIVPK